MGFQDKLQHDGSFESESKKWVVAGIPLRGPLKHVCTKASEEKENYSNDDQCQEEEEEDCNSITPKERDSRIPTAFTCPPAPKKMKASFKYCYTVTEFFKPPDLETVFMRHVETERA